MTKKAITSALALMMAAAAPAAYAQTTAPARNAPSDRAAPARDASADRTTQSSFTAGPGQLRAGKMIGSTVYDVQNQDIGSVKDIVLNRSGKVSAVVVDVGSFLGMGGKNIAVALNDFKTSNDRLTLDRTKSQLQSAPSYNLDNNNR